MSCSRRPNLRVLAQDKIRKFLILYGPHVMRFGSSEHGSSRIASHLPMWGRKRGIKSVDAFVKERADEPADFEELRGVPQRGQERCGACTGRSRGRARAPDRCERHDR
ncbi:hypothetical protein EUGRSUZ_J00630 [Eucalyptus grandis]|uniref:Uncharacterized protein n=2 Tax=Eucalyptus grandis TaxID=71139 RepID=A0ACC3J2L8_EUCGR|nr:hypothetical protein EUGRSUZ_J00630 [Eucalyptus grandis]